MHKRDRRSMVFGLGLGLVIAVAVFFVVYIIQRQVYFNEIELLRQRVLELEYAPEPQQIFPDENDIGASTPTAPIETEPQTEPQTEPEPETQPETDPEIEPETQPETHAPPPPAALNHVWVHIPVDIGSQQIAQILQQAGVVTDLQPFLSFLAAGGFNTGLMAGDFMLPLGADFEVIMDVILAQSHR